jgi:muramoyltetrapeptide carboxypeptidase
MALNDVETQAIICARGGYGSTKILDNLDFSVFVEKGKSIIGFSDITAFHLHVYKQFNMKGLHAPMPLNLKQSVGEKAVQNLIKSVTSGQTQILVPPSAFNRNGSTQGILIGGYLSFICHLIGTQSMPNFKNKILMIEEVGEPFYKIDRMMLQLKRAGVLTHLKGVVFGDFTDCLDLGNWFNHSLENLLLQHIIDFEYPVCFNVPIGHCEQNLPIWIGAETKFIVNDNCVEITQ